MQAFYERMCNLLYGARVVRNRQPDCMQLVGFGELYLPQATTDENWRTTESVRQSALVARLPPGPSPARYPPLLFIVLFYKCALRAASDVCRLLPVLRSSSGVVFALHKRDELLVQLRRTANMFQPRTGRRCTTPRSVRILGIIACILGAIFEAPGEQ